MFIGEVLSDFRLLLWPFASCSCIVCLGIAHFGNKFLIIKKIKIKINQLQIKLVINSKHLEIEIY